MICSYHYYLNRGNFKSCILLFVVALARWKFLECFVIIKCTKFGQLILRKIIKIVANRCQIIRLKCTKFYFGCGSPPQTPLGELTALTRPPSWI